MPDMGFGCCDCMEREEEVGSEVQIIYLDFALRSQLGPNDLSHTFVLP
jgi:hypothetical protein